MPHPILLMTETAQARFWARVDKNAPNGCWYWRGACNRDGYGVLQVGGVTIPAHRVPHALASNTYSPSQRWRHTCRVSHCVNPAHVLPMVAADPVLTRETRQTQRSREREERAEMREELNLLPVWAFVEAHYWCKEKGLPPTELAEHWKTPTPVVEMILRWSPPTRAQVQQYLAEHHPDV